MPDTNQQGDANGSFPTEVERLKVENILLKQKADLDEQFRRHVQSVEEQINKGKLRLGFAGLLVLFIASYGTYKDLGSRIQKRLDKEFDAKEIRTLIDTKATKAVHEAIQKQLTDYANLEHNQLKCASDKNGRALFALKCGIDGGEFDEIRAVCNSHGGESYYEPIFPKIDCDKVGEASTAGVGSKPARR